jgi:hypothetical protein
MTATVLRLLGPQYHTSVLMPLVYRCVDSLRHKLINQFIFAMQCWYWRPLSAARDVLLPRCFANKNEVRP